MAKVIHSDSNVICDTTPEKFEVCLTLSPLGIKERVSLVTSTLIKDIGNHYNNITHCDLFLEHFDQNLVEKYLIDEELLTVCASSASDLNMYEDLIQNQLKCTYINQMFDKNYVSLSGEELTNFVDWLLKRKEEFESNGIDCIQQIYHECCRNKFKISEPPAVTVLHPDVEIVEAIADNTIPMESADDISSCSGIDHCGEFYLEPNEWEK